MTITLDVVLHDDLMGYLLIFFPPSPKACCTVLKSFDLVDQQGDVIAKISCGQTNRFSATNKNRLAKYNFWCA
jgi:hypothetical protein